MPGDAPGNHHDRARHPGHRLTVAFTDLREFVARLEALGRLRRVAAPVSRDLEITEIVDRVSKARGAANVALLFERVEGSDLPVLVNAFGAEDRMTTALGVTRLDELGERVAKLLDARIPGTFGERLRKLGSLIDVARAAPRRVESAPCQEVVATTAPSLAGLPILQCWPGDGGRYITLPAVFTRDPVTGARNVGMYRLQVFDERTLGMHWQTHKGGAEHEHRATARMPVAIALGGDPALIYAASAPLPPGIDEVVFAGWLRGAGIDMVRCRTIDLEVPAQAEIVLEGWVEPHERRLEGPFGDHTGYYSLARDYPVFHLTALTRRARPIYPTTIVGRPPQEDYWLGKATERLFLPIMRLMLPEIVDVNMPAEGVFHNLVIVSIRKRYPGQARKVMQALWGMGLMMLAKTIVVVSEHVNVHDLSEVTWRATGNIDPRRDLVILEGPMDDLDHAALRHRFGGKLGIDATEKGPLDDVTQAWPEEIRMREDVRERVTRRWKDYGL
jgi:4-hydroxy-3-polyprenylbenzoate decarboxylase